MFGGLLEESDGGRSGNAKALISSCILLIEPLNVKFLDLLKEVLRRGCCVQCARFGLRMCEWSMKNHAACTGGAFGKQGSNTPEYTGLDNHYAP
jgi:hypothetical protein